MTPETNIINNVINVIKEYPHIKFQKNSENGLEIHSNSLYLKKITRFSDYNLTFTISRCVENTPIDSKFINIPNDVPLKEQEL